jgi:hypothetical protein
VFWFEQNDLHPKLLSQELLRRAIRIDVGLLIFFHFATKFASPR